ncbi:hypothetical protein V8F06_005268 [Rhypophila decipiens]
MVAEANTKHRVPHQKGHLGHVMDRPTFTAPHPLGTWSQKKKKRERKNQKNKSTLFNLDLSHGEHEAKEKQKKPLSQTSTSFKPLPLSLKPLPLSLKPHFLLTPHKSNSTSRPQPHSQTKKKKRKCHSFSRTSTLTQRKKTKKEKDSYTLSLQPQRVENESTSTSTSLSRQIPLSTKKKIIKLRRRTALLKWSPDQASFPKVGEKERSPDQGTSPDDTLRVDGGRSFLHQTLLSTKKNLTFSDEASKSQFTL